MPNQKSSINWQKWWKRTIRVIVKVEFNCNNLYPRWTNKTTVYNNNINKDNIIRKVMIWVNRSLIALYCLYIILLPIHSNMIQITVSLKTSTHQEANWIQEDQIKTNTISTRISLKQGINKFRTPIASHLYSQIRMTRIIWKCIIIVRKDNPNWNICL